MIQTAYFNEPPENVVVNALPTGGSDIWLRRNILEEKRTEYEGEERTEYKAEEGYLRTEKAVSKEEVEGNFEEYWKQAESWWGEEKDPTDHERLVALEQGKADKVDVEELNEALNMILTGATE